MPFPDEPYERAKEEHMSHKSDGEEYDDSCALCQFRERRGEGGDE